MDVRFDLSDFERVARRLGGAADQLPFALANTLNAAAFRTRTALIERTWPSHVEVRNRSFMRAALNIDKAKKRSLAVTIFDRLGRAHLAEHAKGGAKQSRGRLAIPPTGSVVRTSKGVRANQRPRAIIANTPKRALRVTDQGIFVGRRGRLHLRYAFKAQARIRKDVPFFEDFARYIRREMAIAFPRELQRAMRSRR